MMRRLALALSLLLPGCSAAYGRTSLPPSEAHYAKQIPHALPRPVAFARVEEAIANSYDDLPKVLKLRAPERFQLLLESSAAYRTGGPTGPTRRSTYTLEIIVAERTVDFSFDLGAEVETGHFAPEAAIPYIRHDFDEVVRGVERALTSR